MDDHKKEEYWNALLTAQYCGDDPQPIYDEIEIKYPSGGEHLQDLKEWVAYHAKHDFPPEPALEFNSKMLRKHNLTELIKMIRAAGGRCFSEDEGNDLGHAIHLLNLAVVEVQDILKDLE